jgi:hypothetical protein
MIFGRLKCFAVELGPLLYRLLRDLVVRAVLPGQFATSLSPWRVACQAECKNPSLTI